MNTDEFEGHTPAPWSAAFLNHHRQIMTGICRPDGKRLGHFDGNDDEQKANARLLVAAPDLLAEVKRLQGQLRGMLLAYDSIVDAIREFIELEEYCSRDAADWLRYQIDLGGEEE